MMKGSRGRKPLPTFQKKVVVLMYMGPSASRNFALKDSYVIMRGLLPEVPIEASESELRTRICDTIKSSDETYTTLLI